MKSRRFNRDSFNQQNSEDFAEKRPVELIEDLGKKIDVIDSENLDVTMVQAYLAALQEKAPVVTDFDPEQSLNDFKEKHVELFNNGAKLNNINKHKVYFLKIASVACVFLLALSITANAYGVNMFQRVVEWGNDILRVGYRESQGVMELPADSQSEFLSMADAFDYYGISTSNCPTWIPEGFALSEIDINDGDENLVILAVYQEEMKGNEISFFVDFSKQDEKVTTIEKDEGGYTYEKGGKQYYIMTNNGIEQAVWSDGAGIYTLYGDVSEKEIKQIIDSISARQG